LQCDLCIRYIRYPSKETTALERCRVRKYAEDGCEFFFFATVLLRIRMVPVDFVFVAAPSPPPLS
jgi:hypothetical protein